LYVVISGGAPQKVKQLLMPDVVFMSWEAAKKLLDKARIAYKLEYAGSSSATGGNKNPEASAAAAKATVPNIIGMSESDAKGKISAVGLTPKVVQKKAVGAARGVIAQNPSAGTQRVAGNTVTITVCVGEPEWSQWMPISQLPGGVNGSSSYQVETKDEPVTEYRFRTQENRVDTVSNTTGVRPAGYTYVNQDVTSYKVGTWGAPVTSRNRPTGATVGAAQPDATVAVDRRLPRRRSTPNCSYCRLDFAALSSHLAC